MDFCWWWQVLPVGGGGELCLGMVVANCAVHGGVVVEGFEFLFFYFFYFFLMRLWIWNLLEDW